MTFDETANVWRSTLELSHFAPGAPNRAIQFNNAGVLGGNANLVYVDSPRQQVSIGGFTTDFLGVNSASILLNGVSGGLAGFGLAIDSGLQFQFYTNGSLVIFGIPGVGDAIYISTDDLRTDLNGDCFFAGTAEFSQNVTFTGSQLIKFDSYPLFNLNASFMAGVGFNGAAPVGQSAAIVDAAGGAVIDAQARTALNTLLNYLRSRGDIAP